MIEIIKFNNALLILKIEEYKNEIIQSSVENQSCLEDYIILSNLTNPEWFRGWFIKLVQYAEINSIDKSLIFQNILHFYLGTLGIFPK